MGLVLGAVAWALGTTQFALTFHQVSRANPDERIPQFWGRPKHHPCEIYVYRAIAILLLVGASWVWADLLGACAALVLLLGTIPGCFLNMRHNRRVKGQTTH